MKLITLLGGFSLGHGETAGTPKEIPSVSEDSQYARLGYYACSSHVKLRRFFATEKRKSSSALQEVDTP